MGERGDVVVIKVEIYWEVISGNDENMDMGGGMNV